MKKCPVCGNEIKDDALFCPNCGNSFEKKKTKVEKVYTNKDGNPKSTISYIGLLVAIVTFVWSNSVILGIVALVLCSLARKECKETGKEGIKLANIGIVISIIYLVLQVVSFILSSLGQVA